MKQMKQINQRRGTMFNAAFIVLQAFANDRLQGVYISQR